MPTQTAPRNITAAPSPTAMPLAAPARLDGVTRTFGATVALRNLSLAIDPGELVALLGPNGAGKTTAVRLLLGLCAPTSGTARVFGRDPRQAASRTRTGAMLQIGRVPETLKVREHIDAFSSYYPKPLPPRQVIETAGLAGLEDRAFGELSGGQKQRLLFALAICGNPDLLILDEPTVGLDVEARRGMWEQVRRFVRGGRSILLTTHYLEEADALADRVVVIDRGQVIAEGTPQQIKARAAGKRIRCTTAMDLETIRALPGVASVARDGVTTTILASDADLVARALILGDPNLTGLEIASAGLEDAFLALTESQKEVA
ncbi:MAG TPA: ABC transporter ATP-binding protein [Thermoanaerobaculia bacterium]|nr:ABC transporter ATP-binding protein [Thermoanaerobaculia bacterium]